MAARAAARPLAEDSPASFQALGTGVRPRVIST